MSKHEPPAGLSERGQKLWRSVCPRRIDHPETMTLLESALRSLDRADECAWILAEDGLVVTTIGSGNKHKHPLLDCEKSARADFHRAWTALNLQWVPPELPGVAG